ncbi:MAG: ATP-binding protein [Deltaproteobacteria bacterium]
MANLSSFIRKLGFRTKISLSIIAILLLFAIGLSLIMSKWVSQALLTENRMRGISNAVNLSARAVEPLLSENFLELKNLVDELSATDKDAAYTFILDSSGKPLVHTFTGGFPIELVQANDAREGETYHIQLLSTGSELIHDFAAPVLVGKARLGTVRIGMSHARVQQVVKEILGTIVLTIGVGILIVGLVSTALARTVTRKIQVLHHAAEEIIKGNLNVRTAPLLQSRCWEIVDCSQTGCPAYGDERGRCWYLVGTLCPTCADGRYAKKIESCRNCRVYRSQAGDEIQDLAEFFDVMALTLEERLLALRRTEDNLKQQQRLFQTILDVTPDIVSLQGRDLRYQAVNKAFCQFTGKQETEILGKTDAEVFSGSQAQENQRENRDVLEKGETINLEKRIDGDRWLHVIKTAVVGSDGEVSGVLGTSRDITELKSFQDRIIRSQRLESVGQLAAGIAHEINTPLGIILGYAQLSKEDAAPGTELHESLSTIEKYARISRGIVADLLRFSRHTDSVKKPLDLNQMLNQIVGILEHTFGLEKITITRDLAEGLPLVFGDQEKLEQAFVNLLNNARDAITSDGQVKIRTSYDPAQREVVVGVTDTGGGIPPEIRDKIFDPFFTTKGVGKGTGLGLSVTFGIVKDHGGKIDFESTWRGKDSADRSGTAFVIRLPAYQEEPA